MDENEDLTPEEISGMIREALESTVEDTVPPTPWLNNDTTAASMLFAANISLAAAELFRNLASFALGQSALEWDEMDKQEFIEESLSSIMQLPEDEETEDGG